jgi:AmmeMemoRadiSam system protein B
MSAIREAAVAGRFYPASRRECELAIEAMIRPLDLAVQPLGAIVPHAGWVYSGATAASSIIAISQAKPETIVIFGAVHRMDRNDASVYPSGSWETPLGTTRIDGQLAERVAHCDNVVADPAAHRYEHSIEVQLPLIQKIVGDVMIVPIGVRPGHLAAEIGRSVAGAARDLGRRVQFLGSTDLTHYGPAFGFMPHGGDEMGVRWAKEVNDRRFVDLMAKLDADAVVPEAALNHNACGAGAVAATIGAVRVFGATGYIELEHTTSADAELRGGGRPVNSVGYEAGVFTS